MKRNIGIAVVLIAAVVAIVITVTRDDSDSNAKAKDTKSSGQPAKEQVTASMSTKEVLGVDPQFEVFSKLLADSKLLKDLDDGPYTMFVPSSKAFTSLPADELAQLTNDPTGAGAAALERHLVKGRLRLADLLELNGKTIETLDGQKHEVAFADGVLSVGGVKLEKTDIETEDAEIHVVGEVFPAAAAAG